MVLNFAVTIAVSLLTSPPPPHVLDLVDQIRRPA
jgi:Na+(H+)/acetate symporter ActP